MSKGVNARIAATRVIEGVLYGGRSLDDVLHAQRRGLSDKDGALVSALAYGVLRQYRYLHALLKPLLKRKPQPMLEALLLVGVFQLRGMRIPAHAAVHATVAAAAPLRLGKARGMVNAVLRRCHRDMQRLEDAVPDDAAIQHSHPDWLATQLLADWPEQGEGLLAANNAAAPMHVRVNRRAGTRAAYQHELEQAAIEATPTAYADDGLTLSSPVTTAQLPGFEQGRVSVQDAAPQRMAELLAPGDGQRVLDACAAPGNKTAHVLERAAVDMLALDADAERVDTLRATLERLHLPAEVRVADATQPDSWWDGQPFERIMLDAPCSGTGVIRRHPDIKWLRRADDITRATQRQQQLLAALWPLLVPGGLLVYATCSLLRAEGAHVVQPFVEAQADAEVVPIEAPWGQAEAVGRRIAPGEHGCDGFYYASLRKSA